MINITSVKFVNNVKNKNRVISEIVVDEVSELPEQQYDKYILSQGSTAYIIKSGESYVMGSDGKWYISESFKKKLETKVQEFESILFTKDLSSSIVWLENSAIVANSGKTYNSAVFKYSEFVNLDNVSEITITMPIYTTSSGTQASFGLAFYDQNEKYISGYQFKKGKNSAEEITLKVPEKATQFRTTYYKDDSTSYTYNKKFVYIPLIKSSLPEIVNKFDTNQKFSHYNCIGSPMPYFVENDSVYDFTVTLDNINNKFDSFVETYPDIIARENDIGYDQTGTYSMRHYAVKPMKPAIFSTRTDEFIINDKNNSYDESEKYGFRRILVTLGMHSGTEKDSIKGSIAFIEDLLSSREEWAMFIKNNFIIDIIPCLNPWGLMNDSSNNSSGINLNRDFTSFSQQESKNIKNLIDDLIEKNLVGVIDMHNTYVGGDGYWVSKKSYRYYNDYVRMSQQLNRLATPLFKSLYGENTYNGVHFYLWNYGSGETGQMHEYADSLGLLTASCEARAEIEKTYLASKMLLGNIISMFGTFEKSL